MLLSNRSTQPSVYFHRICLFFLLLVECGSTSEDVFSCEMHAGSDGCKLKVYELTRGMFDSRGDIRFWRILPEDQQKIWKVVIKQRLVAKSKVSCVKIAYVLTYDIDNAEANVRMTVKQDSMVKRHHPSSFYLPPTNTVNKNDETFRTAYKTVRFKTLQLTLRGSWPTPGLKFFVQNVTVTNGKCSEEAKEECENPNLFSIPELVSCTSYTTSPITSTTTSSTTELETSLTSQNALTSQDLLYTALVYKPTTNNVEDKSSNTMFDKTEVPENFGTNASSTTLQLKNYLHRELVPGEATDSEDTTQSATDFIPAHNLQVPAEESKMHRFLSLQVTAIVCAVAAMILMCTLTVFCIVRHYPTRGSSKSAHHRPLSSVAESSTGSAVTYLSSSTEQPMSASYTYDPAYKQYEDDVFVNSMTSSIRIKYATEPHARRPLLNPCVESDLDKISALRILPKHDATEFCRRTDRCEVLPGREYDGTTHLFRFSASRVSEV